MKKLKISAWLCESRIAENSAETSLSMVMRKLSRLWQLSSAKLAAARHGAPPYRKAAKRKAAARRVAACGVFGVKETARRPVSEAVMSVWRSWQCS
jgi:hypothetical protein